MHLTALTKLGAYNTQANTASQLPQQLLELELDAGGSLAAVLGCKQLQHLDLGWCRSAAAVANAAELSQLSSLTGLTHIGLNYMFGHLAHEVGEADAVATAAAVDAAAAAWPLLAGQLRSLLIDGLQPGCMQAATMQHIRQLSRLTCLSMQFLYFHPSPEVSAPPVTPTDLAGVLASLCELQELELQCTEPTDRLLLQEPAAAAAAAAAAALQPGMQQQ
uniref:Uncharacterized protein n=1 Tax=Tetradesmus obliquus TaxID=3088 RepID=A0A383WA07_TETOB|eukprot:jgi/Sobl393_1/13023/SZX74291.1